MMQVPMPLVPSISPVFEPARFHVFAAMLDGDARGVAKQKGIAGLANHLVEPVDLLLRAEDQLAERFNVRRRRRSLGHRMDEFGVLRKTAYRVCRAHRRSHHTPNQDGPLPGAAGPFVSDNGVNTSGPLGAMQLLEAPGLLAPVRCRTRNKGYSAKTRRSRGETPAWFRRCR